jgi:prephenate dehydratase
MKPKIILLGSRTFSTQAYAKASGIYSVPDPEKSTIIRVLNNEEILPKLAKNPGAYACMAINTNSGGKIVPNVDSFIEQIPFDLTVLGSLEERIFIGLHKHKDVSPGELVGVMGHDRALAACENSIKSLGLKRQIATGNNDEAIRSVSNNPDNKNWAALGPKESASKNELTTMWEDFGDSQTFTTFLIMHHGTSRVSEKSEKNKCWIFFDLLNKPESLANFLSLVSPFNLTYIRSTHQSGDEYRFGIELEIPRNQVSLFQSKVSDIRKAGSNVWILGPYQCA